MKKAFLALTITLLAFLCVCTGVHIGRKSLEEYMLISYDTVLQVPETVPESIEAVDINTATLGQLMTLPGVGQVLAERIIAYRTANGPFATVDDLVCVEGIGVATLEQLREYITIGG